MPELLPFDAIVAVVDDDVSAREGLSSLIRSVGLRVETFASAQEFLARSWRGSARVVWCWTYNYRV